MLGTDAPVSFALTFLASLSLGVSDRCVGLPRRRPVRRDSVLRF
jgi:hypothetical protein